MRFNTLCAACHEGEFSERLSFDSGIEATEKYIRHHADDVPPDVWHDLAQLLTHTKQTCAYYPMAIEIPKDGRWDSGALAMLHNAKKNAWFIPLGHLPAGRYLATLYSAGPLEGVAQIISARFDITDFPLQCPGRKQIAFVFEVDRSGIHYLRIRSAKAQALSGLEIQHAD